MSEKQSKNDKDLKKRGGTPTEQLETLTLKLMKSPTQETLTLKLKPPTQETPIEETPIEETPGQTISDFKFVQVQDRSGSIIDYELVKEKSSQKDQKFDGTFPKVIDLEVTLQDQGLKENIFAVIDFINKYLASHYTGKIPHDFAKLTMGAHNPEFIEQLHHIYRKCEFVNPSISDKIKEVINANLANTHGGKRHTFQSRRKI